MLVVAWRRCWGSGERVVEVVVLAGAFAAGPDVVHVMARLLLGGDFLGAALVLACVLGVRSSVAQTGSVGVGVCLRGLGHFC